MRISINFKTFMFLLLLIFGIFLLFSINLSSYIFSKTFTIKEKHNEYETIISAFEQYFQKIINDNETFLNRAIELIHSNNREKKSTDKKIQIQMLMEIYPPVKYLIFFDQEGYIREFYPFRPDVLNLYLGYTEMFRKIEKATLSGPHVFLIDRHSYYAYSRKFNDTYVLMLIDIPNFNDYLKKLHDNGYVSFILDEKGKIIAHYEEVLVNEGANIKMFSSDIFKISESRKPTEFIINGEKYLLYSKYLPFIDKYIFIGNEYARAFARYDTFKKELLGFAIFLTLLALGVSLIASIQLQKPFLDLFRLVRNIKNKSHDLNPKKTYLNEFNNLTESIVEMGKAILDRDEKLSKLFETSRDAIIISTIEGELLEINPFGLKIFGYQDKSQIQNLNQLYYNPQERSIIINKLMEKGYIDNYEIKVKRYDGSFLHTLFYSSLVRDEGNKPAYIISVIKDITDKVRIQEQLFQAQKMESIGRLAGSIAHDLNNMLTVISSNNQLIQLYNKDNEKIKKYIDGIDSAVIKTKDFIKKLLAFSKRQVYELNILDINEILKEEIKLLKPTIREDIKLEVELLSEPLYVNVDRAQFTQILLNLLVNAIEAMPEGGNIKIGVERKIIDKQTSEFYPQVKEGEFICLIFSDTGKGISEEIRDKIFDPFFTTKEHGTGLGLSIVYSIVEQHKGFINVYSEAGVGTTFKVYLPLAERKEEGAERKFEKIELEKKRILIVEDRDEVRFAIEELLKNYGFQVYSFAKAAEVIENFDEYRDKFDICLSDIIMPEMSGIELYRKLKQLKPDIKFIFMTGYANNIEMVSELIKKGTKVLSKPFSIQEFLEKIREIK